MSERLKKEKKSCQVVQESGARYDECHFWVASALYQYESYLESAAAAAGADRVTPTTTAGF